MATADLETPPTTAWLMLVFMTLVGIAVTPVFGAGFLICVQHGFMASSCLMRQQRAGRRRAVGWCPCQLWFMQPSTGS